MTTDERFLQAILDDPEDDALRLVSADWLEEHDQPEWAEFIGVQVLVERRGAAVGDDALGRCRRFPLWVRRSIRRREDRRTQRPGANAAVFRARDSQGWPGPGRRRAGRGLR
jgi:uncharacterized protein (TIGR02996 family)